MINQAHPEVSLFRPSISFLSSSELQEAIFPARRSVEIVRIWEIFAHVRLGKTVFRGSNVSGNEPLGSTPVNANAITVPERSLKTVRLMIETGRRPPCS